MRHLVLVLVLAVAAIGRAAEPAPAFRFDFGPGPVAEGWTQVQPGDTYNADRGYGFEPGGDTGGIDRGGDDALRRDFVTGNGAFFFSVAVPEGNYRVTVTLGDAAGESATTIKAELRRLMLENIRTAAGQFERRSFIVNVRRPEISPGVAVGLKERERTSEIRAWDDRLTLEFNGTRPCVCAVEIAPVVVPTVYILGDSTVCDQPEEPWASWGQMLPRFLAPTVAVANHAESGESVRSSNSARRLDKVLSALQEGDWVLIQFGHNDMKAVTAAAYQADLREWVTRIRAKGGVPVLISPVERKAGANGNTLGDFPAAVAELAAQEKVAYIDLHAASKVFYQALGRDLDKAFQDGTHHNNYGAYELAKIIVEGLRAADPKLAGHIRDDLPRFDPARPDPVDQFRLPSSGVLSTRPPLGD